MCSRLRCADPKGQRWGRVQRDVSHWEFESGCEEDIRRSGPVMKIKLQINTSFSNRSEPQTEGSETRTEAEGSKGDEQTDEHVKSNKVYLN